MENFRHNKEDELFHIGLCDILAIPDIEIIFVSHSLLLLIIQYIKKL